MDISAIATELSDVIRDDVTYDVFEGKDAIDFSELEKERHQLEEGDLPLEIQWERRTALREKVNGIIRHALTIAMQKYLPAILPKASLWFKGETKPNTDLFWVISPYEHPIVGSPTICIALQKADKLLMGYLIEMETEYSIWGVEGEGATKSNLAFIIGENEITKKTSRVYAQLIKGGGKFKNDSSNFYGIINAFAHKYRPGSIYDKVNEGINLAMCNMAQGQFDFVTGIDVCYHDIAIGICIVEQAGGIVTDFSGSKEKLFTGEEFFASNKIIHRQFMKIAKNFPASLPKSNTDLYKNLIKNTDTN